MRHFVVLILGFAMLLGGCNKGSGKIKIGFLVKQPEELWFQNEWKFAQMAADKYGFELIKIPAQTDERAMTAIDSLATQGAQGFVICTPNVTLGPAIVLRAQNAGLKLMTVDDQFVGPDGKFMDVHHMGISAKNIGKLVGQSLLGEMKRRGWKSEETGAAVLTFEQLDTAKERTNGAMEALIEGGFPKDRIFKQSHQTSDTQGAFGATNALLTTQPGIKQWLVAGMNDAVVLGAVRAMAGRGLKPEAIIGIGINGDTAIGAFREQGANGFNASVLLSSRRHGYETAERMYKWIKDGVEPPKVEYTSGILITRENYKKVYEEQGLKLD
jgi:L-arabinose transport system substrate-binding protein